MANLAVVSETTDDAELLAAARPTATLLGAAAMPVHVVGRTRRERVDAAVSAIEHPDVVGAALWAAAPGSICWDVMSRVAKPLLVVPAAGRGRRGGLHRILIPLDGRPETAAGVSAIVDIAAEADIELCPLHVFDATTAPAFWDQAAHSHDAWVGEFRRRNIPTSDRSIGLRHGTPAEEVLAAEEDMDLVVIGWARDLSGGRAQIVRQTIADGEVPVLLVGVP